MAQSEDPFDNRGVHPPPDVNPRTDPALDFPDKPFQEMTPADYDVLGYMSGLEVHQQLDTRSKLFCRCPAGRRVTKVDAEVLRHMRPTLSELGEYDGTALMEFKTRKEIVYLLERGTVCTYEMDDTPPFGIDEEAVRIAIEMAELCRLNLVSELHVMRKQYLDGSIPTGFQRTAMVGLAGSIPFRVPELGVDRDLSIRQLSLEEDSCREVSDVGHRITFRTDRLGMPLTEMVTEPELLTPFELQAGGRLLAEVARATGKIRRGSGAARQDVNVSVAGGRRVEIKGVHHHRRLPLLVHTEAFRQLNLLRVRAELERRGVKGDTLSIPLQGLPWEASPLVQDVSTLVRHSNYQPARQAVHRGEMACAVKLPGYAGLLTHPTQPGVTFAREIADRVRVIACPVHHPFMTHSDLGAESLSSQHWAQLTRILGADSGDAIVVVWAPREDAATAAREVLIRAQEALAGIPAETRQAFPDGTTGFERILPGADRMYPDTDTPPLPIPDRMVLEVRAQLAEPPWVRQARYQGIGLDSRAARALAVAPWAGLFDEIGPADGEPARRLAGALEKRIPFHMRRGRGAKPRSAEESPSASRLAPAVRALEAGEILPEALTQVLDRLLEDMDQPAEEVLGRYRRGPADEERLAEALEIAVRRANLELKGRLPEVRLRWAMGQVAPKFLGKMAPLEVEALLAAALGAGQEGGGQEAAPPPPVAGSEPALPAPPGEGGHAMSGAVERAHAPRANPKETMP
jgi:glutamyl-tRNA(Gln) amidotransferase subunit E